MPPASAAFQPADTNNEANPFESDEQPTAVSADEDAAPSPRYSRQASTLSRLCQTQLPQSLSHSQPHSHPQPHDQHRHHHHHHHHAHHTPSAAPMFLASHGGAAIQGVEMADYAANEGSDDEAAAAGDENPFDTPQLPAHSRAHHKVDVGVVRMGELGSEMDGTECADEVVPHWREELKVLLALALPSVLINLTSVAMQTISQMLVGHISVEALAATVCSWMFFGLMGMFTFGFAGALDTLASQSFGAGSMEGVNLWTKRALLLVSLLTISTMLGLAFAGYPVLRSVLGQSEEISRDGAVYCRWMVLGLWPQNMTIVLQKYLQAQGVLWPIIWQGIGANVFNLAIEALLIWPAGMGLQGSILGMSLARWVQFIWTAWFVAKRCKDLERAALDQTAAEVVAADANTLATTLQQQQKQQQAATKAQNREAGVENSYPQGDQQLLAIDVDAPSSSSTDPSSSPKRSPSAAALSALRNSSRRLVSGVRSGVVGSAALVSRGAKGAVAYAKDPRTLVHDMEKQRAEMMEGVWNKAAMIQFIKLGCSSGAMTGIESWAFDGIGILAATLTVTELDAHYVMLNIALICYFTLPLGISIAASIRIGHLVGMGHVRTAQLTSKLVGLCGAVFMSISGASISLGRNQIGWLFSSDAPVVAHVARIAPICGIFQLFDGIQGSTSGVLRGLGLQRWAAVINLLGLGLFGVSCGYLFAFQVPMGLPGLWWGLAVGLCLVALGNCTLLWRVDWHAQVAAAQARIAADLAEYAQRRAEILAEATTGKIVGEYGEEIEHERQRQRQANGHGQVVPL